jgi:hypothetical protein
VQSQAALLLRGTHHSFFLKHFRNHDWSCRWIHNGFASGFAVTTKVAVLVSDSTVRFGFRFESDMRNDGYFWTFKFALKEPNSIYF